MYRALLTIINDYNNCIKRLLRTVVLLQARGCQLYAQMLFDLLKPTGYVMHQQV